MSTSIYSGRRPYFEYVVQEPTVGWKVQVAPQQELLYRSARHNHSQRVAAIMRIWTYLRISKAGITDLNWKQRWNPGDFVFEAKLVKRRATKKVKLKLPFDEAT